MNQPPNPKNGDVDGHSSASSGNGAYVPPGRRNQILSPKSSGGSSSSRGDYGSNGQSDDRFANFRQKDVKGGYEPRGPRSGSDNLGEKPGASFFDRPNTSSAPRRSKWQEEDSAPSRDDRERGGGRGRRPQLGADGLAARDTRLEEELFGNHSNTGINFDKYQVRFKLFPFHCLHPLGVRILPVQGICTPFTFRPFHLPFMPQPRFNPTRIAKERMHIHTRCNHPAEK